MSNVKLILGTMTFGESVFSPQVGEFVNAFLDEGYDELDTAYVYNEGNCERLLGEVLEGGLSGGAQAGAEEGGELVLQVAVEWCVVDVELGAEAEVAPYEVASHDVVEVGVGEQAAGGGEAGALYVVEDGGPFALGDAAGVDDCGLEGFVADDVAVFL